MFEKVNPCHPDKVADRIAGALVDLAYRKEANPHIAVEVLIGHGVCHIIAETSAPLDKVDVTAAVRRIAGNLTVDYAEVPQDGHLADNQADGVRCGDNGIFRGMPVTEEQKELSQIARDIFSVYPNDGKYILDGDRLILCQSNAETQRLREIYSDLSVMNAFGKADDTLTIAAKSIAEIITLPGIINLDFADVNTTMKDGGVALMSNGFGEGEGRVRQAVEDALNSPLLSNNDVKNAKKILFNVYFSEEAELRMEEMNDVHNFMSEFNRDIEVIWGTAVDNTLGNKVKMTILATGFTMDDIPLIADKRRTEAAQMTEEELRLEEERIEKERKERDLIGKYYGASAQKAGRFTSRAKAVVLTQEELDDDALIALIEDNPTYNRDPKIVARARSKVAGEDIQVSVPTTAKQPTNQPRQDSQRGGKQVISFR